MQAYDFSVTHRSGSKMQAPDAPSCNPAAELIDLPLVVQDDWYTPLYQKV